MRRERGWAGVREGQKGDLRDAVRDDGVVDVVAGVLVLGTLLVQAGDLKRKELSAYDAD